MRRAIVLGAVTAVLLALVAAQGASARVSRTVVRCETDDLQAVIDAAPRRATLRVRGTCVGNFTIARDIRLRGVGLATLQGDGGTVVTIAEGAQVVLTDIVVTGGTADVRDDESQRVAGIYNSGFLKLEGSTSIQENTEYHCGPNPPRGPCTPGYPFPVIRTGGVLNHGKVEISDRASVRDNVGGIRNYGTLFLRDRASVSNNHTVAAGAGIWNGGLLKMFDRSIVNGNTSNYRAGTGGGIANEGTTIMNDWSAVEGNEATQIGGGVYNTGTLRLNDRAAIRNNISEGIYASAGSSIILNGRYSITGNTDYGIRLHEGATIIGSLRGVTGNTPDNCFGCPTLSPTPTIASHTSTPAPTRTAVAPTRTVSPTAVATRAVTPTAGAGSASASPTTGAPLATATAEPTPVLYMSAPRFQLSQKVGEPSLIAWTLGLPTRPGPNDPNAVPEYTLMVWRLTFDRTLIDVVAFESQGMDCAFAWLDAGETQLEARCTPPASNYTGDALTMTTLCLKPYGRGTEFGTPWDNATGYVVDRGREVPLDYIGGNYTNSMRCTE